MGRDPSEMTIKKLAGWQCLRYFVLATTVFINFVEYRLGNFTSPNTLAQKQRLLISIPKVATQQFTRKAIYHVFVFLYGFLPLKHKTYSTF